MPASELEAREVDNILHVDSMGIEALYRLKAFFFIKNSINICRKEEKEKYIYSGLTRGGFERHLKNADEEL